MLLQLKEHHESHHHKEKLALLAMVSLGFGEVFGSIVLGCIIDKIGSRKTSILNVVIVVSTFAVTISNLKLLEYSWLTFLMCFFWGF